MKKILVAVLALALLSGSAYAQGRGEGRGQGQGPRMGAPAAQGAPAMRGPGMGQRGGGPGMGQRGPGMSPNMNHAIPRPPAPMPPAYRPNYAPRPHYGYGPRGYAPYGGAYYGYRPYGYGYGYGVPYYYPQLGIAVTPGGWAVGGVYGGISVYYEKQTVVADNATVTYEASGPAFVIFEVDAVEAEVYVDGSYEGVVEHFTTTPLQLTAGEHAVELRLEGEKVGTFKIRPGVSQTVKIRAKLLR